MVVEGLWAGSFVLWCYAGVILLLLKRYGESVIRSLVVVTRLP